MDLDGRILRVLAVVTGVMLAFGAATVVVRTGRSKPAKVLGGQQSPTPSIDSSPSQEPSPTPTPSSASPSPSPKPSSSATPRPSCRNSYDPACGPFSWTRSPGSNGTMHIDLSYSPGYPNVGDTVTFTIRVTDDAAATIVYESYGDGPAKRVSDSCPARYGPWDPPARKTATRSFTFKHVYKNAGTFKTVFTASSTNCGNPYGNTLDIETPVTVSA